MAESLACGTPVLGSRLGAIEEIITDGRTGLHFTPGDPTDLGEKVEWAWNHPSELTAMGREARRDYESRYTSEMNYSLLMAIYQQVIKAHSEADVLRSSATNVLRKRYKWFLWLLGVPGLGDLVRGYIRDHAIDWAISKLG